ncbi:hypothetical protein CHU98_g6913 [Xylaria longipes]|nr:hypothetical protein CHU98_g6913 [Xylaria longipes]
MICHFRAREATNPLDKVFAFQGLAGDTSSISREAMDPQSLDRVLVYPDYARHNSFLSIDLAKAHIRSTKTLSIIALADFARQDDPRKPDNTDLNSEKYIPNWCPAFMNKESVREGLQLRPIWSSLPQSADPDFAASDQMTVFDSEFFISSPERDSLASIDRYSYQLLVHILPYLSLTIKEVGPAAGISLWNLGSMTRLVLMRHMGLGPANLAVDDEVYIVLGLQVPAILRKASKDTGRGTDYIGASDNDWLYVGQAYVHELMVC